MIPDSFWPWPYGPSLSEAVKELEAVLKGSALAPYLDGPTGNLAEYLALIGREWDVNPWWAIISGQREQSVIRRPEVTLGALNAWQGYVGLDDGRVALPGYYGVYAQAYRSLSQVSWYMNHRADPRTGKTTNRWRPGVVIKIEKEGIWQEHAPASMSEFCQLSYTPHLRILEVNESLAQEFCPKFL